MALASLRKKRILVVQLGRDADLLELRRRVLLKEGSEICNVSMAENFQENLQNLKPDLLLLDWTIPMADRKALAETAKTHNEHCVVLTFHHSANNDSWTDCACDTREGFGAVLSTWNQALKIAQIHSHEHTELEEDYVFVADASRHYVYASPAALNLLGYTLSELLKRTVDDVTFPGSAVAPELFEVFLRTGCMEGEY